MNNLPNIRSCDACDASRDALRDAKNPVVTGVVTHVTLPTHTHIRARTRTPFFIFHVIYVTSVTNIKTALIFKAFFCDASCDAYKSLCHSKNKGVLC